MTADDGRGGGRPGRERVAGSRQKILTELRKVIVGQDEVVDEVLMALFCGGHCLITGVPGLAKTLLVKTIAQILDLKLQAHPVHARPDAGRHYRHRGARRRTRPRAPCASGPGRSSRRSSSPTRSTGPRPRPRPRIARGHAGVPRHRGRPHVSAGAAVLRAGDAEPNRAGRHLSAARKPSSIASCSTS